MYMSTSDRAGRITRRNKRRMHDGKCVYCMHCDRYGSNGRKPKGKK